MMRHTTTRTRAQADVIREFSFGVLHKYGWHQSNTTAATISRRRRACYSTSSPAAPQQKQHEHEIQEHEVVVVGGGTAGLAVSHQLFKRTSSSLDLAIIEPSTKHYYQPGWTMVGGGIFSKAQTVRDEAGLIPPKAKWIQSPVLQFLPDENAVVTDNRKIRYKWLVVCPGLQINWDKVKGLKESLGRNGVCSNYSFDYVDKTWEFIQQMKGKAAVFTHPATPIKCGGAPQKIMYLAEDYWKKHGLKPDISFFTGGPGIFPSPHYGKVLTKICQDRGIKVTFKHDLVEVQGDQRLAVFKNLDTQELVNVSFDFLHVTPPMGPPDVIKNSALADAVGWLDLDKQTTRHKKYANVFGLGDASNLPTSKTAAAVSSQSHVTVSNLIAAMNNRELEAKYDGYTSCPLVTGYDKLVLAEFDYTLGPRETFPFDQSKERRSMYYLKRDILPKMYWNYLVKGSWTGPSNSAIVRFLTSLKKQQHQQ